ncbi:ribonuclease HII [Liquorilactobacillus sicerae]|uniref:ribonuclease HII n=1 Tax=Liquorilactobacillus sicerae TaxID=1416943 RepID=UPI00248104FA|nr:ribonuclease HII [Liquorilactobacillus sicerae]
MANKLTIKQIKAKLKQHYSTELVASLAADPRIGVQRLVLQARRLQEKQQAVQQKFAQRFVYEQKFWQAGKQLVAGIDEVGRGPLAGPVVAAAVILPHDFSILEVNDSKQLSPHLREKLSHKILAEALAVGIGIADNRQIDQLNIYQATRIAMKKAVANLKIQPQQLIIDAMQIETAIPQLKLIKADAKSNSVAAASIVAKVWRDRLMVSYDEIYPGYGFAKNAGYGTAQHLAALKNQGITPIHRLSFAPVAKVAKNFSD